MKNIILVSIFAFCAFLLTGTALAQGKSQDKGKEKAKTEKSKTKADVKKDKKHGPPPWAPAHGYKKRHVYFPKQQVYYDTRQGVYISKGDDGKWKTGADLPKIFQGIDLNKEKKVELELDDAINEPQNLFEEHKKKYASE